MKGRKLSRREFLGLALAGGAATVGAARALGGSPCWASQEAPSADYALVIDTTKCTCCGACVEACNLRNELPGSQSYAHLLERGDQHVTWFLPVQCQHCADPPCATVCPTDATYIHPSGVVLIDEKLCVGCKYCMVACPYQARIFDEERGVADKCWLCLSWVLEGESPACVEACVTGARLFGRRDDPDSEVGELIESGMARPLHPEFGTRPAVLTYIIDG
ncbi:MAG: 4Fe-4S dicluster domain-containing protein [Anaerolineae bacterium]